MPNTFDIPSGATAVDEQGRETIFLDGEQNVPIASFDATTRTIEFRLYGETYFIAQSALVAFKPGGVNR